MTYLKMPQAKKLSATEKIYCFYDGSAKFQQEVVRLMNRSKSVIQNKIIHYIKKLVIILGYSFI